MKSRSENSRERIVLFDGDCAFCHRGIQFILRRDTQRRFICFPLDSKRGQEILANFDLAPSYRESLVLMKNNRVFTYSNAVLEICLDLTGFWPLCFALKIIPKFLRDIIYRFIAKHR